MQQLQARLGLALAQALLKDGAGFDSDKEIVGWPYLGLCQMIYFWAMDGRTAHQSGAHDQPALVPHDGTI
jgi:hypothetical protein